MHPPLFIGLPPIKDLVVAAASRTLCRDTLCVRVCTYLCLRKKFSGIHISEFIFMKNEVI